MPAFPGPADPESGPLLYSVDSPQFTTPRDGTLVVHRGVTGALFLEEAAIYSTDDGGASWAGYRIPLPVLAADFVDARHGWVITAMSGGLIDHRSLYGTVDGGRTWRLMSGPQDYFVRELNFVTDTIGFIGEPAVKDQAGQLLQAGDGGATWVPIQFSVN